MSVYRQSRNRSNLLSFLSSKEKSETFRSNPTPGLKRNLSPDYSNSNKKTRELSPQITDQERNNSRDNSSASSSKESLKKNKNSKTNSDALHIANSINENETLLSRSPLNIKSNASIDSSKQVPEEQNVEVSSYWSLDRAFMRASQENTALGELSDEESKKKVHSIRQELKRLGKHKKKWPKIVLQDNGCQALLSVLDDDRKPLLPSEVRCLLHHLLLLPYADPHHRSWFVAKSLSDVPHVALVIVEGVSINTLSELSLQSKKMRKYHRRMLEDGAVEPYAGDYGSIDVDPCWEVDIKTNNSGSGSCSYGASDSNRNSSYDNNVIANCGNDRNNYNNNNSINISSARLAWLPSCSGRMQHCLEMVGSAVYGHTVVQDLFTIRYTKSSIDKNKKKKASSLPASMKIRFPEHLLYKQATGNAINFTDNTKTSINSNNNNTTFIKNNDSAVPIHMEEEILFDHLSGLCQKFSQASPPVSECKKSRLQYWGKSLKHRKAKTLNNEDKFDRRKLLSTLKIMLELEYPMPQRLYDESYSKYKKTKDYTEFVATKDSYDEVKESSPLFSMDCEFYPDQSPRLLSVVNECEEPVYSCRIRSPGYSDSASKKPAVTLQQLQQHFATHLPPGAILVGHNIACDLRALKMYHPYIIDTSVQYHIGLCNSAAINANSLKSLSHHLLHSEIQDSRRRHRPQEDARAALQLVKLKLSNNPEYGHVLLGGYVPDLSLPQEQQQSESEKACIYYSIFEYQAARRADSKRGSVCRNSVAILATPEHEADWQRSLAGLEKLQLNIRPQLLENNNQILDKACVEVRQRDFVVAHLQADPRLQSTKAKSRIASLASLDKQISRLYDALSDKSVLMVVFAGSTLHNGLLMHGIKGKEKLLSNPCHIENKKI